MNLADQVDFTNLSTIGEDILLRAERVSNVQIKGQEGVGHQFKPPFKISTKHHTVIMIITYTA